MRFTTEGRVLVDSNVLVYVWDSRSPAKRKQAIEALDYLSGTGDCVLSAQVLGEFFHVVTRKLAEPLSTREALHQLELFMRAFPVLAITPLIALEAGRGVAEHLFSYWDAQLWATARLYQVQTILSEDFSHNSIVEGVRFINPFMISFY